MNKDKLINREFDSIAASYQTRDTMLYALGVAAVQDPLDSADLRYAFEKDLQALPSFSCVLAHPGPWLTAPDLDVQWVKLLHAEQRIRLEKPLSSEGFLRGNYRVKAIADKGEDRGAMLYFEKTLSSPVGDLIATVESTYFLRGDGGCGDYGSPSEALAEVPQREADGSIEQQTSPLSALIYRLSGDYNPLHADPVVASKAGFDRPILQGLCSFGVACQSLVKGPCEGFADRLQSMSARFTRPVFPGERLQTRWWKGSDRHWQFQTIAMDREVVVLDRGEASLFD